MIIATTNAKGGVGKTTIAVHLAALAHQEGKQIIVLDCDAQQSCSRWLSQVSTEITIHRASTQKEIFRSVFELRDQTDLLIADGPGGIAEQTRPLLLVSDLAVVPCGPSKLDLEATLITLDMIEECRMVRKDGYPHAVFVPNRIQQHMHLSQELMRASTRLEVPVTETYLRYLQVYARAPGLGQVVWDIPNAPSDAVGDMQLLCREILTYAETHQSA